MIRLLCKLGADVDEHSSNGTCPLINAYNANDNALVKLLIELGADETKYREIIEQERIERERREEQERQERIESERKIEQERIEREQREEQERIERERKNEQKRIERERREEQKQKERYYYLREENRIYTALKFKERKGFFRRVLPASWFLTFIFYGVISFIVLITAFIVIPEDYYAVATIVFLFLIPITLWVIGIKKRLKYLKEKKKWKECTDSGKRPLELVFKEFQEMEKKYQGQE
jgi:flagellar biosynthesis GTPase FlhF